MKCEGWSTSSQQWRHGEMGVMWWVSREFARWVSCGGGVMVWTVARFQALTSQFLYVTFWRLHDVGNGKVSLSLSPLTLSVLPLSFSFLFFFCFSIWSLWTAGFTFLDLPFFFRFTCGLASWVNGSQFWRGPKLQSKGGPSLFFLKINLLKNNLGQGGPKPPPVSIPEGTC